MIRQGGVVLRWPAAVTAGAVLLLAGGLAGWALVRTRSSEAPIASAGDGNVSASPAPVVSRSTRLPDVVIPISAEAQQRAGIVVTQVSPGSTTSTRRFPATVQPNAYKRVSVTPFVSGRVTRVIAEVGQSVARSAALAEVYSPELSDAESRYIGTRAELDAHERELQRTEQLVSIGAASRQELERLHAEHAAKLAEVETARSRLSLFGLGDAAVSRLTPGGPVDATASVRAPIAGVVLERFANPGMNVDASTALFTIADLSTVWVVADVYEQDFGHVRTGLAATVTFASVPDRVLSGVVSYVDPQLDPQSRTAKARIELANPRGELRVGMIGDVSVAIADRAPALVVPRSAVQHLGDRTVVYLAPAGDAEHFIEREVRLGNVTGDTGVVVLDGVSAGDRLVGEGSFAVRAEAERLGLRGNTAKSPAGTTASSAARPLASARVLVTELGYQPSTVSLPAGARARVTFVRTTDQTCGTEITFPSLNIRQPLPLNQPVTIDITVPPSGSVGFQCGMNMLKGQVLAQ
jgi:RND family efflux transporter MFP subunit